MEELKNQHLKRLTELRDHLGQLTRELSKIENYWAGSWLENENLYLNFIDDKSGHVKLSPETLLQIIQNETALDFSKIWKEVSDLLGEFKSFNEDFSVELSIIKSEVALLSQVKLLEKLEKFSWGYPAEKFVQLAQPKRIVGSVNTAERIINQGYIIPPHESVNSKVLSKASEVVGMEDYLKLSYRLLRETELLLKSNRQEANDKNDTFLNLDRLLDRFHDVARQLEDRYSDRETILIKDEYDVQDLLHGLLRLYLDDVRPEDYSPSYAGRNTRCDFLLKKEKVMIEVKKTRKGLKEREVGDQLLQDIARYRNNPDCDVLYCFVYDPEGKIRNPRGLENDLESESSDSLLVVVKIRP